MNAHLWQQYNRVLGSHSAWICLRCQSVVDSHNSNVEPLPYEEVPLYADKYGSLVGDEPVGYGRCDEAICHTIMSS